MSVFQELQRRQFIYQATDAAAIEKLLSTEKVTFYVGFDPTGFRRGRSSRWRKSTTMWNV